MRSILAVLTLTILACGTHVGRAQEDDGANRFVIPPDAASPLRRVTPPEEIPDATPTDESEELPEIVRDLTKLPAPVKRMRELILKAARSGDINRLKPLLGVGDQATQLAFDALETDPISFLMAASGDPDGHEVLAILVEVLEAGFVRVDEGDEGILYIWPYFAAYPIDALKPEMKVELFQILTGGEFEEMKGFGAYVFYRVGITEDGEWRFFLSGDA